MLTRLEVNGFKNLIGFAVDLGPFNCIAGANGVGKSNIFDVIHFLSLLADHKIIEAAQQIRNGDPETGGLRDLFWTDGAHHAEAFSITAEMLIEADVLDDFGRPARASSTFLRYDLSIGYVAPTEAEPLENVVLLRESLNYITKGETAGRLKFPHSAREFRNSVVFNKRRVRSGYISTEVGADGQTEILIHQEGDSSGRPQRAPARSAPKTIVGTSNTSTTPTILAARREMQRWRMLALEPSAMRGVDRLYAQHNTITANGDFLPATLYRLEKDALRRGEPAEEIRIRIANRLAQFVPIRDLRVDVDQVRQLLTLEVREASGGWLPARSLSDGTLRFLTLCIMVEDYQSRGLICMEEPENGIHPAKMQAMVQLLRELSVDPEAAVDGDQGDNPLRQIIVATHSPTFVQMQEPDDLLLACAVKMRTPEGRITTTVRCRPLSTSGKSTWRTSETEPGVSLDTILTYLTTLPGAQIKLPLDAIPS